MKRQATQTEQQLARKLISLANQPKFRSANGGTSLEVQYNDGKRIAIPRPAARPGGAASLSSYR